jgi:hypothetical protein
VIAKTVTNAVAMVQIVRAPLARLQPVASTEQHHEDGGIWRLF